MDEARAGTARPQRRHPRLCRYRYLQSRPAGWHADRVGIRRRSITSLHADPLFKSTAAGTTGFHYAANFVRGYGWIDLSPRHCDVTFRGLAAARNPRSGIADLARFAVEAGLPGIQRA